ncbi:transporter substrate-binding domain-containing protein, partial [bacterium]|nr:transporter substrate-binding domain-containing protein [bacterium]
MKKLIFKIIFVIFFSTNLASEEVLKIGIDPTYPPWTYENHSYIPGANTTDCDVTKSDPITEAPECKKKDPYLGAEIDFAKNLCIRIEYECEFIVQNFDEMIPALKRNEFDIIIAAMSIKPERQKEIDFSIPYFAPT